MSVHGDRRPTSGPPATRRRWKWPTSDDTNSTRVYKAGGEFADDRSPTEWNQPRARFTKPELVPLLIQHVCHLMDWCRLGSRPYAGKMLLFFLNIPIIYLYYTIQIHI